MASIQGLGVLVVEDDLDNRELVELYLESQGARVKTAASAAAARAILVDWSPDVILTDISLPDEDGFAFLTRLRASDATRQTPVIAVTGRAEEAARSRAIAAGFHKFISKPFDVFALPAAVASAVVPRGPSGSLERQLQGRDVRALLMDLNATTSYRYTSILRFLEGGSLESVWTVDRDSARVDEFPPDMPLAASYCVFVEQTRAAFTVADASEDPRVGDHPKRDQLRSYCGVPLFRADGTIFGSLCHYDPAPRPVDAAALAEMQRVAGLLAPLL